MWTQIKETTYSGASSSGTIITLGSSAVSLGIKEGMWLVITPYSKKCEIREVISINAGTGDVTVAPAINNANHSSGDTVYVQTSPVWDILLFGARASDVNGTYSLANTDAINFAVQDCNICGGGIVAVPKGEYCLERNGSTLGCVYLNEVSNITFRGEGIGISILKIKLSSSLGSEISVFQINDPCEFIVWENLTIDVNCQNTSSGAYDMVGLYIVDGNDKLNSNFKLIKTEIKNSKTAAISLNSYFTSFENLSILNCDFNNNVNYGIYTNGASPINNISILNSDFNNNGVCDIFSDEYCNVSNMMIANNSFRKGVSLNKYSIYLKSIDTVFRYQKIQIVNNIFDNALLNLNNISYSIVSNNIIHWTNANAGVNIIEGNCESVSFQDNVFTNRTNKELKIEFKSSPKKGLLSNLQIQGNIFQNASCNMYSVLNASCIANKIEFSSDNLLSYFFAINYELNLSLSQYDISDFGNLIINDNQISGNWSTGIRVYYYLVSGYSILNIINIANNLIEKVEEYGIKIYGMSTEGFWQKALIATSNAINAIPYDINSTNETIYVSGSYQIQENPYQEVWISNGNPNGLIEAPQGSIAIDKTIEADNRYLKNTLDGNLGWTPISELDKQLLFWEQFQHIPTQTMPYNLNLQTSEDPNVNVFTTTPAITKPWKYLGGLTTGWQIKQWSTLVMGFPSDPASRTFIDTSVSIPTSPICNGILKSVYYFTQLPNSFSKSVGIVFRLYDQNNFWEYYLTRDQSVLPPDTYELHLYKVQGAVYTSMFAQKVQIGRSNRFVLQVIMQDNFISLFYNDLLLHTLVDDFNAREFKHGIVSSGNVVDDFGCQSFKLLIP